MKKWFSDLCTSTTPVLGAKSGGHIMRNSPQYAAWWCISRLSNFSESRRGQIKQRRSDRDLITEHLGENHLTKHEAECEDIGKRFGSLGVVEACYSYTDASGGELFQVLRFDPKSFRQRRRGRDGRWVWKNEHRAVLYRLPLIISAIQAGSTIYITEGEKDAHALLSRGYIATTTPGGASEPGRKIKWMQEHTDQISGAHRVCIWAHNDPAGIEHATSIALAIRHVVDTEPEVIVSDRTNDVYDHFQSGGTMNDVKILYGSTARKNGHHHTEDDVDVTVSRFLFDNPEFVPQTSALRARLLGVSNRCEWESELEAFAQGS